MDAGEAVQQLFGKHWHPVGPDLIRPVKLRSGGLLAAADV
jgi:hypothetical protein